MYEIHIQNRGPEGVRGYKQFRTTKDKSDLLQKRLEEGKLTGAALLEGVEATAEELENGQESRSAGASSAPKGRAAK